MVLKYGRIGWAAIVLSLGVFLASPALAAPLEQIDCVRESYTPEERAEMARDVVAGILRLKPPKPGESDAYEEQLKEAAAACGTRLAWTKAEEDSAASYFLLSQMTNALRTSPQLKGVDFAILDARAQDLAKASDPGKMIAEQPETFMRTLADSGVPENKEELQKLSALYLLTTAYKVQAAEAFASGKTAPMLRGR